MGKNSLLKSTSKKKKSASKKKDEEMTTKAKKTTPKAKVKPKTQKAAPKAKKAAPKTQKAAPKAKASPKAAPKAQKAAAPKKKLSLKEIMGKKFDTWKPEKPFTVAPDKKALKRFTAPPLFSDLTGEEARRIKELLFKKFDMKEIKAAGKKAAAEKAAAEKAAAEKAAAEKAAAEKAAAEKAAAEKAAEPTVSVTCGPPGDTDTTDDDPLEKGMKYAVAVLVVLIALMIGTSAMNTNNYYVKPSNGAVEIWQGKFAPMGEELLIVLPGVQSPDMGKDIYSKTDVFPLIFNYYVEKADTLLEVPGMPDFEGIRSYLNKALKYSTSKEISQTVFTRLNNIDLMILLYKADVAASKGTVDGLENARAYLAQAAKLNSDKLQADLIAQKIVSINDLMIEMEVEAAKTEAPAAPAE